MARDLSADGAWKVKEDASGAKTSQLKISTFSFLSLE
jgi:hypothetical protein